MLEEHDGETEAGQDPRPEAVHLVGAGQLECGSAVGAGEELTQECPVDLRAGLDIIHDRSLQEGRGEGRRGEGEEVEGDEEELVGSAANKEENLFEVSCQRNAILRLGYGLLSRLHTLFV